MAKNVKKLRKSEKKPLKSYIRYIQFNYQRLLTW